MSFTLNAKSPTRHFYEMVLSQIEEAIHILEVNGDDISNESISKWSMHQQLEHLNITGRSTPPRIMEALASDDISKTQDNAALLFERFQIPRYTEQAPEFSIPNLPNPKR